MVDLTHGAAWHRVFYLQASPQTRYTAIIEDLWRNAWGEVDRSQIQHDEREHPEAWRLVYGNLAESTSEIVERYLPGWSWRVGHGGANSDGLVKKLFVKPRDYNDRTREVTITGEDIGYRFEIEPSVDPRNFIVVTGDDDPASDQGRPLYFGADDRNSRAAYGTRDLVVRESGAGGLDSLQNAAVAILEQRKFDLWQGRFDISAPPCGIWSRATKCPSTCPP